MMSAAEDAPDGLAIGASRVGAELRAARQRLGWSLPDVSATLRIRLPYLEAIEDGRLSDMPGNAYAVGFLRSYSTFLGLDAAEVARRFRAEAQEVNRKPVLAFPAPVPERGVPAGAVVLLGVLLAAGAYGAWYKFSGDTPGAAPVVPAVPERLSPLADRAAPPSNPSPQVASILPPPSLPAPAPSAGPLPAPTAGAPPAPVAAAPAAAPIVAPADASRMVLRFKGDGWAKIAEKGGRVVLPGRTMHAGDSVAVPKGEQLLLSLGNLTTTELLVDGVVVPLGPGKTNIPLDPDVLKARPAVATPPSRPAAAAARSGAAAAGSASAGSTPRATPQ